MRRACLAVLLPAVLLACSPPKYVEYTSIWKDWRCRVPWGWNVITDREGDHFAGTDFLGAFDPDFYLGVPSFRVRWYEYSRPHRLRDGSVEVYSSAQDFISQMLSQVYGPQSTMIQPVHEVVLSGGLTAQYFVVLSPAPVPFGTHWGTEQDRQTGRLVNLRQHAYVVVPLKRGFYVLIYPATRGGYKFYERRFNELVNTFTPLSDGPGGPATAVASSTPNPWAARGAP